MLNPLLLVFVFIALAFDFLNGFHDSANVVATTIASKAMSTRTALGISALTNFTGPFLFGVAVATTIGTEVVNADAVTIPTAMAALLSAIIWNIITWWLGIPSSSSHALIGGFVGAAMIGFGTQAIQLEGLTKVLLALFLSPILGFFLGYGILWILIVIGRVLSPKVNIYFRFGEWITTITLGLSHGTNDAQKTMGILTFGLVAFGLIKEFAIPTWVILASAGAMSLGTVFGGWRLIRTMGAGFYRIRPMHAFSSQVASTAVILGAALLGGPVSTTQVISSSIVGAGSAERVNMVRWGLAGQIAVAWLITIPVTVLLGGLLYLLLDLVF